MKIKVSA